MDEIPSIHTAFKRPVQYEKQQTTPSAADASEFAV